MIENIQAKRLTCDKCGHTRLIEQTEPIPYRCANRKCQSTAWNTSAEGEEVAAPHTIAEEKQAIVPLAHPSKGLTQTEGKPHPAVSRKQRSKIAATHHNKAEAKQQVEEAQHMELGIAERSMDNSVEAMVASRTRHPVGCNCFACIQCARFIEQQRKEQPPQPEKKRKRR